MHCSEHGPELECIHCQLPVMRAEIARLTAERDAAIARAEMAERVAGWAVRNCVGLTVDKQIIVIGADYERELTFNGTDADLYRALVEACEGGRE